MKSKVIVITGASAGIGAALARLLGTPGHQIVLAARREKELREVASAIGSNALVVPTDVTQRVEVEHLKDAALAKFDHVDVWINNAGRGISRKVQDLSDADFEEMMLVNVKSAVYGIQAVLPHFQERGEGHIINISSFLSRIPFVVFRSAYSASKAALNVLTANLRMDLAATHPNIHISLVMPGVVLTDFQKNALGDTPQFSRTGASVGVQTAEEVAAVIGDVIEHPRPEVYTNPASADLARRYFEDVAAFEANLRQRSS
jgi:NADP-dependent 3-hydroxy acid dehydrogenase YdfG